ncbi:hypothetical protein [Chitinophaga sp. CF418]|uniref:hypothetical protein n=1 Tax=Chitinophaga sp. CF418 TaxID=1855287 RepID=UPI00091C470C|nr:hypothetical protein [Chitinophaga sp. CF418]SHN07733.1 hypothetical protein SAMN05216311_10542 [Chitinophaga sp. CF418]
MYPWNFDKVICRKNKIVKTLNLIITKVENSYLSFTSNHGEGQGIRHISQQFEEGRCYGVEFDFLPYLNANENTKIGTTKEAGFYCEGDGNLIVALVEHIDEDDEVCLRIAPDCMIMAYRNDDVIQTGDRVEIRMSKDEFIVTLIGV